MSLVHCVIESYSAYEAAKAAMSPHVFWWTTSPGLLERLKELGERVASLEEDSNSIQMDALAEAGYKFTSEFCERLNELCDWREYVDIKQTIGFGLNQCFYPTFYKAHLLQCLLMKCDLGEKIVIVGDSKERDSGGLFYHRFDNLYTILASKTEVAGLNIFRHVLSEHEVENLVRYSKHRRLGGYEKLLSFLNNTVDGFLFKCFLTLKRAGLYPLKYFSLFPRTHKSLYIYKTCELIDELILGCLRAGARIGMAPPLPTFCKTNKPDNPMPRRAELEKIFSSLLAVALTERGFDNSAPLLKAAEAILKRRLFDVLEQLYNNLQPLTKNFDRIAKEFDRNSRVITNSLTSIEERIFANYCASKNIEVTAFEHGLVYGLSEWSRYCAQYAGMISASSGVYHSEISRSEISPHAEHQRMLVGGLPKVVERVFARRIQRALGRKILDIGGHEHVVIFVANLDRNNFIYGPCMENDFENHKRTRSTMNFLLRSFPQSTIVLKLYPTARYLDNWDWPNYSAMDRVRVVRDVDFRFLRAAADIIFLATSQSTLGWSLGAGVPVFFLEPERAPVTFSGCSFGSVLIPGVRSVRLLRMVDVAPPVKDSGFLRKALVQ